MTDRLPEDVVEKAQEAFGLDRPGVEALGMLIGACPLFRREGESFPPDMLSRMGMMFAYPGVAHAAAFMAEHTEPILCDLARRVASGAYRGHRAGALFALAVCEEERGNIVAAEGMVNEALADDPDFLPAVREGAFFAFERGNARRALELLLRSGEDPDDPIVGFLRSFVRPPTTSVSRNAPCPCGSGRKHKLCCLRGEHPLERRARWLYFKVASWAVDKAGPTVMRDVARRMFDAEPDSDVALDVALRDATVFDVALFDEGVFARYLDERGVLLPRDERDLARSWMSTMRAGYEVVSVTARRGCRIRDLITGAEIEIDDPDGWDSYECLDVLFGRVVPTGGGHMFFGAPVAVPRPQRHSLVAMLEGGGEWSDIVEWRQSMARLPVMTTMEGEEVVMCSALYEVPDAASAKLALDRVLDHDEDGTFASKVEVDGEIYVRGWISVEDDRAEITANSVERFEKLTSILTESVTGARLVSEDRRRLDEMPSDAHEDTSMMEALPPEVLDALEARVAAYEEKWLDMSIPALGGATPREAAESRVLRHELDALLDDLAWSARHTSGPMRSMDAARIRARLGI